MTMWQQMLSRASRVTSFPILPRHFSKKSFIQPTPLTHPHLLGEGELLPFTKTEEFVERRKKLAELIRQTSVTNGVTNHIVILPSASKLYMTGKIPYVFRQNSDFLYYTGCFEPDSVLVLHVTNSSEKSYLFLPPSDPHSELWEGPRFQASDAESLFKMDEGCTTNKLEAVIESIVKKTASFNLWYEMNQKHSSLSRKLQSLVLTVVSKKVENPLPLFHQMRVIKSESEIKLMKKACHIGALSLRDAMTISEPEIEEFRLWTEVEYQSKLRGAQFLAYPPVVAGGNRANTIHYVYNNNTVQNNELVLMDAGCEYFGYSSDITRTWPVNGQFSSVQKALYEAVLEVQEELIKEAAKCDTLDSLYAIMVRLLGKNLTSLGLIKGKSDRELYKTVGKYCPHHVSHYLGMDVHDVPNVPKSFRYRPGTILTIEPGVYIPVNDFESPKEFRGLGIRIEDDVLITKDEAIVLTKDCPKSVCELEKVVGCRKST